MATRPGTDEAKRQYVLFDGVRAPGRDNYIVRYNADEFPWVALLNYDLELSRALKVANERLPRAEADLIAAYQAEAASARLIDDRAKERRRAGGVRRGVAGIMHVVESTRVPSPTSPAQDEFDRWCNQAVLLRDEIGRVRLAIEHLMGTVKAVLLAEGSDR